MKKLFLLVTIFFIEINFCFANTLKSINMDIYIDKNGTANFTEIWNMKTDEKTENYKPLYNLGTSKISNFKVSENGVLYKDLGYSWNINASFDNKAYKSGIHLNDDATELCWGISSYGEHSYKLEYKISNFVVNLDDGNQMLYWTLIPHKMNPSAKEYEITIRTDEYLPDTIDVWGYGDYGAYAYVKDGVITLASNGPLAVKEYVVALVKFPTNTFELETKLDEDFDYYLNLASKDAKKYESEDNSTFLSVVKSFLTVIIPSVLVYGIMFGFIILLSKLIGISSSGSNFQIKFGDIPNKLPKDVNYFRDIPCDKNIYHANYIAKAYDINRNDKDFVGALLLKWIRDKKITIKNEEKVKNNVIIFNCSSIDEYTSYQTEIKFFDIMYEVSKDGMLTINEFKKYCKKHYNKILNLYTDFYEDALDTLKIQEILTPINNKKRVSATQKFYDQAVELKGLKNFLEDFSSMDEKIPLDVMLWKEYLMYAQIFGIASEVNKQLKDLYPEIVLDEGFDYSTFVFITDFSRTSYNTASNAHLTAASSYSSGGGGFSSGGGGGGSFGGGGGGGGSR